MREVFKKILIFGFLFLSYSFLHAAHSSDFCVEIRNIISKFVVQNNVNNFGEIEDNIYKFKSCRCETAPLFYQIYKTRVDLPNSHARVGISPEDVVTVQETKMKKQIEILKNCKKEDYLPLIDAMIDQDFNEYISQIMSNLKIKNLN